MNIKNDIQAGIDQISTLGSAEKINKTLRECVLGSIDCYFNSLLNQDPDTLNLSVLGEVEAAMYEATMKFTKGNQVQAARVLGVARGTLRTKLKQYFGTTQVGGLYHKYSMRPFSLANYATEMSA